MAEYSTEKFYWLKLKRDFFKRHDIKIIEDMDNGKDYILFYLKLLCESIDHNGNLRFSDTIPYNEKMLSSVTNTNVDIVRSALKVFTELNMIEFLDSGTIYMNEIQNMIGSKTIGAEKKEIQRQKQNQIEQSGQVVDKCPPEIDIEKDIYIYNKENNKEKKSNDYATAIINFLNLKSNDFKIAWEEFLKIRKSKRGKDTDYSLFLITKDLEKFSKIESEQIEILNNSIKNKWTGVFSLINKKNESNSKLQNQRVYTDNQLNELFDNCNDIEI